MFVFQFFRTDEGRETFVCSGWVGARSFCTWRAGVILLLVEFGGDHLFFFSLHIGVFCFVLKQHSHMKIPNDAYNFLPRKYIV